MSHAVPNRRYPEVATELKAILATGEFTAGDKLPAERHLAERLNVSRSLLREALIMMEIQGFIEVRQGSGIYVLEQPSDGGMPVVDIGPFELLQARQVIESAVAEVAARTVTKNDIEALQKLVNQQEEEVNNGITDYSSDEAFHLRVAQATQNSVLEEAVHSLWLQRKRSPMWEQLHRRITNGTYWMRWARDHQQILNALKRKDPIAARHTMWQHLENVREIVFELSDVDAPHFDGYLFPSHPPIQ